MARLTKLTIALISIAAVAAAPQLAPQFHGKHKYINNLPSACLNPTGDSEGLCTLYTPVYNAGGYAYDFCVVCTVNNGGGNAGAQQLTQSIQQLVSQKVVGDPKFSRKSDLDFVVKGVDQPLDMSGILSGSPALWRLEDVYYVFASGQMGRIEYKHGRQDGGLDSVTCRYCPGGIGAQPPPLPVAAGVGTPASDRLAAVERQEQYGGGGFGGAYGYNNYNNQYRRDDHDDSDNDDE